MFNNREIALLIWAALLFCYVLLRKNLRESFSGALKAAAHTKLIIPIIIAAAFAFGIIYSLRLLGVWYENEIKDVVVWFVFAGIAMLYRGVNNPSSDTAIREMAADSIKVTLLFEFIVGFYTFPFLVELLLVPALAAIVAIKAVCDTDKKLALAGKLAQAMLTTFGFAVIGLTFWGIYNEFGQLFSADTAKAFVLPVVLGIAFLPLSYAMALLAAYEQLFVPLKFGEKKGLFLKATTYALVISTLKLDLRRVCEAKRILRFDLSQIQTFDDLNQLIRRLNEHPASTA